MADSLLRECLDFFEGFGGVFDGEAEEFFAVALLERLRKAVEAESEDESPDEIWEVMLALGDRAYVQSDNPPLGNEEALAERSKRIEIGGAIRAVALAQLGRAGDCLSIEPTLDAGFPFRILHEPHDDGPCPVSKPLASEWITDLGSELPVETDAEVQLRNVMTAASREDYVKAMRVSCSGCGLTRKDHIGRLPAKCTGFMAVEER